MFGESMGSPHKTHPYHKIKVRKSLFLGKTFEVEWLSVSIVLFNPQGIVLGGIYGRQRQGLEPLMRSVLAAR